MRHAVATVVLLASAPLLAHPGHGAPEAHLHGFAPELLLAAALLAAWLVLRRRG